MEMKQKSTRYRYSYKDREELYSLSGQYPTENSNTAKELDYEVEAPASQPANRSQPAQKSPSAQRTSRASARRKRQRQLQRMRMRARALATALVIIIAFGAIAGKAADVHLVKASQVAALEDEIKKLSLENDGLKRNVDELSSVQHIEQAALAMGMKEPGGTIYVTKDLLNSKSGVDSAAQSSQMDMENSGDVSGQAQSDQNKGVLEKILDALIPVISG